MGKINDISGQVFGKLTVIKFLRIDHARKAVWLFQCDCGTLTEIRSNAVLTGKTLSCGCLRNRYFYDRTTHGMSHSRVYCIYKGIIQRCTDVNTPSYERYGPLGVCDRWLESFENFYEDMGDPPSDEYSIDRVNNNKGYSPENCRWANQLTQCMNRNSTIKVEYDDEVYSLMHICREVGISYPMVRYRLFIKGIPIELIIPGAKLLNAA